MMRMTWLGFGAVFGFVGVAAGAFGAHALRERLEPRLLEIFETGARYQLIHAVALVALSALRLEARWTGWSWVIGVIVFSGSLYVLALTGVRAWGAVTPIGGVALLVGWASLAWLAWRSKGSV